MHRLRQPYLLFLGDVQDKLTAKTAFGLRDWCGEDVVGEWSLPGGRVEAGETLREALGKIDEANLFYVNAPYSDSGAYVWI